MPRMRACMYVHDEALVPRGRGGRLRAAQGGEASPGARLVGRGLGHCGDARRLRNAGGVGGVGLQAQALLLVPLASSAASRFGVRVEHRFALGVRCGVVGGDGELGVLLLAVATRAKHHAKTSPEWSAPAGVAAVLTCFAPGSSREFAPPWPSSVVHLLCVGAKALDANSASSKGPLNERYAGLSMPSRGAQKGAKAAACHV